MWLLPRLELDSSKFYQVSYEFGLSNRGADGDNCIKNFQDCMCDKFGINDNRIYEWHIKKTIVKKGEEFINFNINEYEKK